MKIIEMNKKTMEDEIMKIVDGYEELEKVKSRTYSKLRFKSPIIW
jgi:hypothetical protein